MNMYRFNETKQNKNSESLSMKLRTWNQITYGMQNKWSRKQQQLPVGKAHFQISIVNFLYYMIYNISNVHHVIYNFPMSYYLGDELKV